MNPLYQAWIFAAVRAILIIVGTVATALGHHWEQPDEAALSEAAGAVAVLIGIGWSAVDKWHVHGNPAPAEQAKPVEEK